MARGKCGAMSKPMHSGHIDTIVMVCQCVLRVAWKWGRKMPMHGNCFVDDDIVESMLSHGISVGRIGVCALGMSRGCWIA